MNTNPLQDALRSRWTLEGKIPLAGVAEGAVWHRARTVDTGENVTLFIVQGEAALEAADAVRRAYLVEDARLLPVREIVVLDDPREEQDTNSSDAPAVGPITVVEYPMPPAPPLAALLGSSQLHPETARSIIGEAATGLEAARRRGVRHQFIDSNRLFVNLRSGEVTVLGVGVEAAAHVGLDRSRENASFQDTAALVTLLYRTLSGRSPQHDSADLVPRPSTLVDTPIPADLDLLCDLVLNESADDVPETTRELIAALEPWQSIPVTLEAYPHEGAGPSLATGVAGAAGAAAPSAAGAGAGAIAADATARTPGPAPTSASTPEPAPSPAAEPEDAADIAPTVSTETPSPMPGATGAAATAGVAGLAAAAGAAGASNDSGTGGGTESPGTSRTGARTDSDAHDAAAADSDQQGDQDQQAQQDEQPAAGAAAASAASAEAKQIVQDLHLAEKRSTSPFPGHLDIQPPVTPEPDASSAAPPVPASPESPEPAESSAPAAAASLAPAAAASTAQQPAQDTTDPALAPVAATPAQAPEDGPVPVIGRTESMAAATGPIVVRGRDSSAPDEPPAEPTSQYARSSLLRDVVSVAVDSDDPDTYALGPRQPEERSRQSQWIIAGAVLFTIIAAVFAVTTATSGLRDRIADPLETAAAPTTPTETDTGEAPVEPTAENTEEPELPAPEISGVELFAEGGAEPDHTDQQDRLTDGDTETFWSTQHYGSPDFGGIKEGVGMRLSFAEESQLSVVTVTTARNTGGTLELRAVNDDGSPGDVLASGKFAGDGEVRLEPDEPVDTEKVALYIPELPPDSKESDRYRARIAEITVE
ncbi:hypothetical protein ACTXKZ_11035 [Brachybacterium alimentarium]|uniref:hypothetical protein n=1 Tax=Brachybacterium alimentarium TaxID=47845 RepID=UPI003FD5618C